MQPASLTLESGSLSELLLHDQVGVELRRQGVKLALHEH